MVIKEAINYEKAFLLFLVLILTCVTITGCKDSSNNTSSSSGANNSSNTITSSSSKMQMLE